MELKFEVLLSSSIKRRKPWPRFCWLGREKEGVFLLDDNRISEIHLVSGQTKKKTPKLQPLLQRVVTMSASENGMWLAGLLVSGELFLWNKDKDSLKMTSSAPAVHQLASSIKGSASTVRLSLLLSENGKRVFLATLSGQVFLWECLALRDLNSLRDGTVRGRWSQITHPETSQLPSSKDKEASVHSVFVKNQAVGDVCLSVFVFNTEDQLTVTLLKIQWERTWDSNLSLAGFSVNWVSKCFPFNQLMPPCRPVKSRGALVPAFSPDGQLLAVVLNQKDPRATQVLFISTQNFVTVSSLLGGCGSKTLNIPAKYVRSYWVSSVSWTPEGLYLACVLKRGSLLMLARLGGLVSLSTTGCNIEFGPAHFLPLHPLVTYRPPVPLQTHEGALSSSSMSLRDPMRQRYSVTWHPRQPFLIVSDGYMVTVLRMPKHPSSAAIMSALLLDAAQGLENMRKVIGSAQPQIRTQLESMSTLMFTGSLLALKDKETSLSTLPVYLQDTGDTGDITRFTERAQGEDDDSDEGLFTPLQMEDGGKLEFASMFDTLHAQTHTDGSNSTASGLQEDLDRVHRNLMRAWALGVSMGGAMKQRERLLKYTIICIVRFTILHRVSDCTGRKNRASWVTQTFHIFRTLLSFLPWDATHTGADSCLKVTVELTRRFVDLFLSRSQSDLALSSQNFNAALLILQEASRSLNQTYSLPSKALHFGEDGQLSYSSDMFSVPLLQEDIGTDTETITQSAQIRKQPSNRLLVIWRDVYRQALQYQVELHNRKGHRGVHNELERMSVILPQIQHAVQTTGDCLEKSHALRNFTGEQHFILGEYTESAQVWRAELWAERERAGSLTCYLETRYCLALLYGRLMQYRLREAQGLVDCLAHQLQTHAGQEDEGTQGSAGIDDPEFEGVLSGPVGREAACAVVQSLGRFMAAYFTNHPLYILPPHNVDVLPPLHIPHDAGKRVVELCQSRVAVAVRSQHLSEVWTVDYALELLLLGGLLPEAAWMAQGLGDWKMAATLGLAYTNFCSAQLDLSSLKWRELHLPTELQPAVIFQGQLEALLGRMIGSEGDDNTDPVSDEDVEHLQLSVQEILKASVMAEVDIISQPLTRLLDSAKERAISLSILVPPVFYLPAPPLYCPQPSPNTQDSVRDAALVLERETRCQVSGLVQKVLLLFRASHSSRPAAQWYISNLHRCRHLLHKIQKKASEPKADLIPEGLKKFSSHHVFFKSASGKDRDSVTTQTINCFRELCALCWMLHARDQLTVFCRRYQMARKQDKDPQVSDVSVSDLCVEALRWACRLLPFCRFLNAEEALQDLVLSLLSELTPCPVTAEMLARVFPDEDKSVRVPLREKYTSLVQRLRPVFVLDTSATDEKQGNERADVSGETMMIVIQDQLRQRRRQLRHLSKHLCAPEPYLWEREKEEDRGGADSILMRLSSLGASLSDSTLTDCGRPLVYSEGDTAETLSEPLSPDLQTKSAHSSKTAKFQDSPDRSTHENIKAHKSSTSGELKQPESTQMKPKGPSQPIVGTWEFELEDEEYTLFLELFLSYVLEKDRLHGEESELPLLSSFSQQLRTRELHSVTFDMLTTLKRRQTGRKRGAQLPVFRAGRCFQTLSLTAEPSIGPDLSVHNDTKNSTNATLARALPGLHFGKQQGLFGLRQQAALTPGEIKGNLIGSQVSASQSKLPMTPQVDSWVLKMPSQSELDVQVQLDSALETRFPQLARLLEWMMRWADRRILLAQPVRKKSEGSSDSVVIRAKASTPAVLSALELLEQRYSAAQLGGNKNDTHSMHPSPAVYERGGSVASVLQPITGWGRDRESSVDTGYPASAHTPITLPDLDAQHTPSNSPDVCVAEDEEISDLQSSSNNIRQTSAGEHDESSVADVTEASWLSSNQRTAHRETRDQALTLADLECLDTDEHSIHSQSEENHVSGPLENTSVDSLKKTAHRREVSASVCVQQTDVPSLPIIPPQSERQSTSHLPDTDPPQTQTDPIRQLLQDELFRLVQLQQINFMSLMQVVGASFTNLPLQSNVILPQTTAISTQTQCQPTSEHTHALTQNTPHRSTHPTRATVPERVNDRLPVSVNSGSVLNPNHEMEQRSPVLRSQDIEQLTIRPHWSQDVQTDSRNLIPTSQGLLTTANNHMTTQTPPTGVFEAHPYVTPQQRAGLKLLQLHPPQPVLLKPPPPPPPPLPVREAWAPSSHANFLTNQYAPSTVRRSDEMGRTWAEPSVAPLSHLHTSRYNTSERTGLPPAPHRAPPAVGLPLLRFHPDAQRPVTLPRIPQSTMVKPPSVGTTVTGHFPRLQLLHRDPDPPSAGLRFNAPPLRTPRLIPLEELLRWAAVKQMPADTKLQLLKTENITHGQSKTSPSSKRRKRRDEKNKEKIGVTFRPEDSIIPPDESLPPAEVLPDENDGYVIPLGSFDSELTGQMLLDKVYSTSAELHAFASTQKKPPEIQDACTNTEPEPSRSITDKAVSVKLPTSPILPSAPPAVFLNLRFSENRTSEKPENRRLTESNTDVNAEGRRFINVIDLPDDSLLQNMAPPLTPPSPPSSAQLQLLAASVVNSAPNPAFSSAPVNTEHFTEEPAEELPEAERVISGDPVTLSVLSAVKIPPSGSLERALLSRSQISARLSEMDAQLIRLQNIADHMDREFANTRLLVNTIETLNPAMMASVELESHSSPLRVLREVRSYSPPSHRFGKAAEEERTDEEILSSSVFIGNTAHPEVTPLKGKQEQRAQDTSQADLTKSLLETPGKLAEETLGLSGLSDVQDILSELIRDGALSRSALSLSQTRDINLSRSEVKQNGVMMEEERRDVRMWMRRRQRERLMEYCKQREEKRERERKPFTSTLTHNPTSVDLTTSKKIKEERDRMVLQEHHEQRARDACSLITDLLMTPLNLPAKPLETCRSKSQSSGKNPRIPKGQSGPHGRSVSSLGKTVVIQRKSTPKPHGSLSNRLGLHRPASALPGDRLSQVTRRGMLTDLRARQGMKTIQQIKLRMLKENDQTHVKEDPDERDVVSPWSPPADVRRILGFEEQNNRQCFEFTDTDPLRELDGLDALSDSTGSILSKLDWDAIEKLVAEEEEN
ncbi:ciliogenesis and planar polarity effector 1 isoform X2 [Myxocyprinus asiaticus]|uniref:ciliogenesis and planar polarity effector 1 isoform X2 n=1 Tax=Myxocyprinus asiaticus TaxID=70543 RepID=UPI0022234355|nr:ciliogenesis and planar polarity effector 1 isoform X2 [Myxocyprinus asiaticus]